MLGVLSPDGQKILTSSNDGTTRIWPVDGAGEPTILGGHVGIVDASFSPDGSQIATVDDSNAIRIWNSDGKHVSLTLQNTVQSHVFRFEFSGDGEKILTRSSDSAVVWRLNSVTQPIVIGGTEHPISEAVLSVDGKKVISVSEDGELQIWNADAPSDPITLGSDKLGLDCCGLSPDGTRIAAFSRDDRLLVFSITGNAEPTTLGQYKGALSPQFNADDTRIISHARDGTVQLWNVNEAGQPIVLRGHEDREIKTARFNAEGTQFVTTANDGTARVWRVASLGGPEIFNVGESSIQQVEFSPDGRLLLARAGGAPRVWRIAQDIDEVSLPSHEYGVKCARFGRDSTSIALCADDGTARSWRTDGTESPDVPTILGDVGEEDPVWGRSGWSSGTAISPDANVMLTESPLRLWYGQNATPVELQTHHLGTVSSAAFNFDGTRVIVGFSDGTARLWDTTAVGDPVVLSGHTDAVWSVEFHPDGTQIVTAGRDFTARIWRAAAGIELVKFSDENANILSASLSADKTRIVLGKTDNTAEVWRVDGTGDPIVLRGHSDRISSAAFSPNGKWLATGSEDGVVRIWPLVQDLPELAAMARKRVAGLRELSADQKRRYFIEEEPVAPTDAVLQPAADRASP